MKKVLLAAALLSGAAAAAVAAEIHGTISEGGKPVPAGTAVRLECSGTTANASTDAYGSYSVKIGATGACELSLSWKGGTPALPVTIYDKPSRYDVIVAEEGGKTVLRRK